MNNPTGFYALGRVCGAHTAKALNHFCAGTCFGAKILLTKKGVFLSQAVLAAKNFFWSAIFSNRNLFRLE